MTVEEMKNNTEKLKELNKNLDEALAELEVSIFLCQLWGGFQCYRVNKCFSGFWAYVVKLA